MNEKRTYISYPKGQFQNAQRINEFLKNHGIASYCRPENSESTASYLINKVLIGHHLFLPVCSDTTSQRDEKFKKEILCALNLYRETNACQIIPLLMGKDDEPHQFLLEGFEPISFFYDFSQGNRQLLEKILSFYMEFGRSLEVLDEKAKNFLISSLAGGVFYDIVKYAYIIPLLDMVSMDEESTPPKYNFKVIPRPIPSTEGALDLFAEPPLDTEESFIRKDGIACGKKFISFFYDSEGQLIGDSGPPSKIKPMGPTRIQSVPSGTKIIIVAIGTPDVLLPAEAKLKAGEKLDENDSDLFLLLFE